MRTKDSVRSFKDNLKGLLLRHSFRPALEMELICILLVVLIGAYWGITKCSETNKQVCSALEQTVVVYGEFLEELAEEEHIIHSDISLTQRAQIMKKLYMASIQAGYDADLYLLDKDGNVMLSSKEAMTDEQRMQIRNLGIREQMKQNPDELQMDISKGSVRSFLMGKAVKAKGEFVGGIVVQINGNVYDKLLAKSTVRTLILQKDYWVLTTNGYHFTDSIGKLIPQIREKQGLYVLDHGIYFVMHSAVAESDLEVYTLFDYTDTLRILLTVLMTGGVVLAFLFFAGLANTEKIAVKATEDISELNEAFLTVTSGNLRADLDLHSSTELENIGEGFNQMIESLKRQMEMNKELAETVAAEQVKRLASQFNSHFLFNTLDNIRFICRIAPEIAENMVILLSELLRYNTADPNEKVALAEDLDYIRKYFEIFKIRQGDRFSYELEVEEDIKECLVLRLLVQPIVENAMKYGLGTREHLHVQVKAFRKGEDIWILCQDDGEGMSQELLHKIRENLNQKENVTPHLGLYNVHRRLQLTYGSDYGIHLENRNGLCVMVNFPVQVGEALEEYRWKH